MSKSLFLLAVFGSTVVLGQENVPDPQVPTLVWVLYVAVIALMLVSFWKLFTKAGKPGWASIIPIYNNIVMLEIAGKPIWWFFMLFIPGVNIIFAFLTLYHFSKAYGKAEGFSIGVALLSFIFIPLLAFSDARYKGPALT
jgi:Family of unknown function (DUF5684)